MWSELSFRKTTVATTQKINEGREKVATGIWVERLPRREMVRAWDRDRRKVKCVNKGKYPVGIHQGSGRLPVGSKGREGIQKLVSCSALGNWFPLGQWSCGDTSLGGEMMSSVFHLSTGTCIFIFIFFCTTEPPNLFMCQLGQADNSVKTNHPTFRGAATWSTARQTERER